MNPDQPLPEWVPERNADGTVKVRRDASGEPYVIWVRNGAIVGAEPTNAVTRAEEE